MPGTVLFILLFHSTGVKSEAHRTSGWNEVKHQLPFSSASSKFPFSEVQPLLVLVMRVIQCQGICWGAIWEKLEIRTSRHTHSTRAFRVELLLHGNANELKTHPWLESSVHTQVFQVLAIRETMLYQGYRGKLWSHTFCTKSQLGHLLVEWPWARYFTLMPQSPHS